MGRTLDTFSKTATTMYNSGSPPPPRPVDEDADGWGDEGRRLLAGRGQVRDRRRDLPAAGGAAERQQGPDQGPHQEGQRGRSEGTRACSGDVGACDGML